MSAPVRLLGNRVVDRGTTVGRAPAVWRVIGRAPETPAGLGAGGGPVSAAAYHRVRLFPGVSVNLSRSGPSLSVGVRGAHITVGRRGVTRTLGIPGTGLFYTSRTGTQTGVHTASPPADVRPASARAVVLAVAIVVVLVVLAMLAGR